MNATTGAAIAIALMFSVLYQDEPLKRTPLTRFACI
jgi:hypothetical protein